MWRVYNAAKRPIPQFDDDPVIDYLVMEAIAVRVAQEDEARRKEAERNAEKEKWEAKAQEELDQYR